MENEKILEEITQKKKLKTQKNIRKTLTQYSENQKMSLEKLILEAEDLEDNHPRQAKRQLRNRLTNFQDSLKEYVNPISGKVKPYKPQTINQKIGEVKSFYNHYDITVPSITPVSNDIKERMDDMITQEELTSIINNISKVNQKSVICGMSSSALSVNEIVNLKQSDLVTATSEYHNYTNIEDVVPYLLELNEPIIPTWNLIRGKTGVELITFMSPESMNYLLEDLNNRYNLSNDKSLYNYKTEGLIGLYKRLSKRFNLGKTSTGRNKFHAHAMRSYFSTQLLAADVDTLLIEFMMGHSIPPTIASYYKAKPQHLKRRYIKVVEHLTTTPVRVVDIKSPEVIALEKENQKLKANVNDYAEKAVNQMVDDILSKKIDENLEDKIRNYNKIK